MEKYKREKVLGKGAFGVVYKVRDVDSASKFFAAKMVPMGDNLSQIESEIKFLKQFTNNTHNTTVRYIEHFQTANHIVIVTEILGFSLLDLLKQTHFKGLPLPVIKNVMDCTFAGLGWIHDLNVIHCDIKPENILLDHQSMHTFIQNGFAENQWLHFKLIDFGSSTIPNHLSHSYIQSRFYRAPEVMLGARYDQKIDIWSAGCVMMECYTGKPLFDTKDEWELLDKSIGIIPPKCPFDEFKTVNQVVKKLKHELQVYGGVPDELTATKTRSSKIPVSPKKKTSSSFSRQSNISRTGGISRSTTLNNMSSISRSPSTFSQLNSGTVSRSGTLTNLSSMSRSGTITNNLASLTRSTTNKVEANRKRQSFIPVLSSSTISHGNVTEIKASIKRSTSFSSLTVNHNYNNSNNNNSAAEDLLNTRPYHRPKAKVNKNTIIFKAFTSAGTLNYPYLKHKRPGLDFHLHSWSIEGLITKMDAINTHTSNRNSIPITHNVPSAKKQIPRFDMHSFAKLQPHNNVLKERNTPINTKTKVGQMVNAFESVRLHSPKTKADLDTDCTLEEDEDYNSLANAKLMDKELANFAKVVSLCLVWDKWHRPDAFEVLELEFFK